jgi:hypothetical protein
VAVSLSSPGSWRYHCGRYLRANAAREVAGMTLARLGARPRLPAPSPSGCSDGRHRRTHYDSRPAGPGHPESVPSAVGNAPYDAVPSYQIRVAANKLLVGTGGAVELTHPKVIMNRTARVDPSLRNYAMAVDQARLSTNPGVRRQGSPFEVNGVAVLRCCTSLLYLSALRIERPELPSPRYTSKSHEASASRTGGTDQVRCLASTMRRSCRSA